MKPVALGEQSEGWGREGGAGPRPPSRFGGRKRRGVGGITQRCVGWGFLPPPASFPGAGRGGFPPAGSLPAAQPAVPRRRCGGGRGGRDGAGAGGGSGRAWGVGGGEPGSAQAGQGRAEASRAEASRSAPPPPAVPEHVGAGGGDLPAGEGAVLPAPARPAGPRGAAAAQGEARRHHGLLRHPQDDLLQSEWPPPPLRPRGRKGGGMGGRASSALPVHGREGGGVGGGAAGRL